MKVSELILDQYKAVNGNKNKDVWSSIIYNIEAYGAKGDNLQDASVYIQTAIDAANADGGGVVVVPPGTFKLTTALIMKPNVILCGMGRHISLLYPSTPGMTSIDLSQSVLTRTYNEVYSLGIVAQATNVTGIKSVLASALRFEDLYFGGCLNNFDLDRGSNVQIEGILVEGTPIIKAGKSVFQSSLMTDYIFDIQINDYQIRNIGNGVQSPSLTFNRCVGAFIEGYHSNDLFAGSPADGILFQGDCQGCKCDNSIIVKPNAYGIKCIADGTTYPIAIELTNIDVDQSQLNCIQLDAGFWHTITGGMFTSFHNNAITFGNPNNAKIVGATIVGISGVSQQGVQVNGGMSNFQIIGNHIEQCGCAVLVSAGASNNYIIQGNDCSLLNTNKVLDNGTGTNKVVANNI